MKAEHTTHTGDLILINAQNAYHADAACVPLGFGRVRVLLLPHVAEALTAALREADALDDILPLDGYRTRAAQDAIIRSSLIENGEEYTRRFVALVGHSEHHTGMAVDLSLNIPSASPTAVAAEFPYDGAAGRFRAVAAAHGFVERYPAGKEAVTGIGHEPWHFRYVGVPHAALMVERGLTLEEYHALLAKTTPDAPLLYGGYRIFRIPMGAPIPPNAAISGDNLGGMIVTLPCTGETPHNLRP